MWSLRVPWCCIQNYTSKPAQGLCWRHRGPATVLYLFSPILRKGRGKLGLEIVFLKNFNSLKIFTVHTVHSFKKVLFQLSLNNRFNLGFIVATAGYHHVNFNSTERRAGQLGREGGEVACSSIQTPTPLAHPPPRSASRASFSPHHPADKTRSRSINAAVVSMQKHLQLTNLFSII